MVVPSVLGARVHIKCSLERSIPVEAGETILTISL